MLRSKVVIGSSCVQNYFRIIRLGLITFDISILSCSEQLQCKHESSRQYKLNKKFHLQIPNSSAVERTTVNRDVLGSNPSWGVYGLLLFQRPRVFDRLGRLFWRLVAKTSGPPNRVVLGTA